MVCKEVEGRRSLSERMEIQTKLVTRHCADSLAHRLVLRGPTGWRDCNACSLTGQIKGFGALQNCLHFFIKMPPSCLLMLTFMNQENAPQPWRAWYDGKDKATALQKEHFCLSEVCQTSLDKPKDSRRQKVFCGQVGLKIMWFN